jgi:dolichyl-phosphate-mannose--protein O-mannosyl transferase
MKTRNRLLLICALIAVCLAYATWMTEFTFVFWETSPFPNYNMLAKAFVKGQLFIDETPPEDYLDVNGKRYLYFGPLPALIRLPALLLLGRGIPTGLMIVLFCAGSAVLFALIIHALTPVQESSDSLLKAVFITLFIFNGYSLVMTLIPSIHHESIASAMFFLMFALYLLAKDQNRASVPTATTAALMGVSLSCCIASRATYMFSSAVLVIAVIVGIWSKAGYILKRKELVPIVVIVAVVAVGVGLLLTYSQRPPAKPEA